MKKLPLLSVLIYVFVSLAACKKETIVQKTESEKTSELLQALIKSEKIDRVATFEGIASFDNTSFLGDYGLDFKFSGGFVSVFGKSWNLLYLKKYEIRVVGGNIKFLGLYF